MTKSIKALAKVLFSAMALLTMIAFGSRASQSPSAGYQEFAGCPSSDGEDGISGITVCWKSSRDFFKSMQNAFEEINSLLSGRREITSAGDNCYIGGKFSVVTRGLPAIEHLENPIDRNVSSEIAIDSGSSTDLFYEQTQLKDCLA